MNKIKYFLTVFVIFIIGALIKNSTGQFAEIANADIPVGVIIDGGGGGGDGGGSGGGVCTGSGSG